MPYKPPRTFGQKAKSFFKKAALIAAFAAAAGGTGYNYYGTEEDIEAKVTAVEIKAPSNPEDAPRIRIHTDHGTFVNETTRFHMKDGEDVKNITEALKPGASVKLTVYGLNPQIGKFSRDDLKIFRNIIKVHVYAPPEPMPQPGDPRGNFIPPEKEDWRAPVTPPVLTGTLPEVDQEAPETSAPNSNLPLIAQNTPQLARDLAIMSRLPLTGYGIYNALKDPNNGITSALFPVPKGEGSTSTYYQRNVRVARGAGTQTAFHEYFHAWQDLTHGKHSMFDLTTKDAVVANLLEEASAVAYEMSAKREAQNHGIAFVEAAVYEQKVEGGTIIRTTTSPSRDPKNIKVFNEAYDRAFAANSEMGASAQEALALQAGGQAVIRRLLSGADASWRSTYVKRAIENVNRNLDAFTASETDPGYASKRAEVFNNAARLSKDINFVPAEFSGNNVTAEVEKTVTALGFTFGARGNSELSPTRTFRPAAPRAPGA